MKAYTLIFFTFSLTLFANLPAHAQNPQGVGINTNQPEGAFHVKTNNGKDIVVAHGTGNLGIHATAPQAKVDVADGSVQIIDGLQQEGRILTSDADGNARWANPIGSAGKLEAVLELEDQDIALLDSVDIPASHFTVDADGYHVYEIRWYATYAALPAQQVHTATHFQLILHPVAGTEDVIADEFEMYHDITTAANDAVTFWVSLSTRAKAGDELSLIVRPTLAPAGLWLRKDALDRAKTTKIIVKRLNMQ
jgi:hypothetical protein